MGHPAFDEDNTMTMMAGLAATRLLSYPAGKAVAAAPKAPEGAMSSGEEWALGEIGGLIALGHSDNVIHRLDIELVTRC